MPFAGKYGKIFIQYIQTFAIINEGDFMKKEFNVKTTFIVTGIIQAIFFILYLASGLYVSFAPRLERDIVDFFGAHMALIPVIPICFCCNVIALISSRYINGKSEKEGRKWLYIILSAMAMSVAWCFGMIPIITIF